jgi:hypothetical protein
VRARNLIAPCGIACLAAVLLAGGVAGAAGSSAAPNAQPAFYITAANFTDLRHQAADDAARFAKSQGPGRSLLVLDFGAARSKGGEWGVSLRSGTFFTNQQVHSALQAAARSYHREHRQGRVTIVYANTNAHLAHPGAGYQPLHEKSATEAGRQQALAIRDLHLYPHESAAVGGDIEPGYDVTSRPQIGINLVAGASAGGRPYFDVGTAPCTPQTCTHGWKLRDICAVTTGGGRQAVPEIYFDRPIDQLAQWLLVKKTCGIRRFAGVSASPLGDLAFAESWRLLAERTRGAVDRTLLVFPR